MDKRLRIFAAILFFLGGIGAIYCSYIYAASVWDEDRSSRRFRPGSVVGFLGIYFFYKAYKLFNKQPSEEEIKELKKKPSQHFIIIVFAFLLLITGFIAIAAIQP